MALVFRGLAKSIQRQGLKPFWDSKSVPVFGLRFWLFYQCWGRDNFAVVAVGCFPLRTRANATFCQACSEYPRGAHARQRWRDRHSKESTSFAPSVGHQTKTGWLTGGDSACGDGMKLLAASACFAASARAEMQEDLLRSPWKRRKRLQRYVGLLRHTATSIFLCWCLVVALVISQNLSWRRCV
jgi:hypothetical protein